MKNTNTPKAPKAQKAPRAEKKAAAKIDAVAPEEVKKIIEKKPSAKAIRNVFAEELRNSLVLGEMFKFDLTSKEAQRYSYYIGINVGDTKRKVCKVYPHSDFIGVCVGKTVATKFEESNADLCKDLAKDVSDTSVQYRFEGDSLVQSASKFISKLMDSFNVPAVDTEAATA